MRFTDVVMSMPRLILAFAFVAMLGPGLVNGALALALTTWPAYARQAGARFSVCATAIIWPPPR
jgi:peptide/nickel transport system permease protein